MFLAYVLLVLGAHPDFWLSDAEFEAKRLKDLVSNLEQANETLGRRAAEVAQGKDDRVPESVKELVAHAIVCLDEARVIERTRAFIGIHDNYARPKRR